LGLGYTTAFMLSTISINADEILKDDNIYHIVGKLGEFTHFEHLAKKFGE